MTTQHRLRFWVSVLFVFSSLLALSFFFIVFPVSAAMDTPHTSINNCSTCHQSPSSTWWTDQGASGGLCGQCHNPSSGFDDAAAHNSATYNVSIMCSTCHDPHYQRQLRSWRPASYLLTGTISSVDPSGAYIISATPLTPGAYTGMLLVPNTAYVQYNYRITGNTATRINIDTTINSLNLTYVQPGKTFAITYGKLVRQAIGSKYVKFFGKTGPNSFADNDAVIDGVCQVCHTQTIVFNQLGALNGGIHPTNEAGTDCTVCHSHTDANGGFRPNCEDCHGYPPTVNTLGGPSGLANNEGGTGSTTSGAHQKHVVTLSFGCDTCHTGGMPLSAIYDKKIQLGFNLFSGVYQTGVYNGRSSLSNGYAYSAGNAGTTITQNGAMTCAATYCHSNGTSVSTGSIPANTSPNWGSGTTTCSSCHAYPPNYANGSPKANSHNMHVNTYSYICNACHSSTVDASGNILFTSGATTHVNGSYDVSGANIGGYTFNANGGACSNISCHSNTSTTWGKSACLDCHNVSINGRAAITPQFSANSHHIQGGTVTGALCYQCHWEANQDGSINPAYHGGLSSPGAPVNLVIYGAGTRPAAYTLGVTAVQYMANGQRTEIAKITTHCLGCHSDQNNGTQPFSAAGDLKTPKQYAWDVTSIDARYSQTGTARWGKYDPSAYPNANVETKYDLTKAYSAHGNASANNQGWNATGDTWAIMASTPGGIYIGGSLASAGNYVYALAGYGTAFYRYSISGNSWTPMTSAPGTISYGGALVYPGTGDYFYALAGSINPTGFYRYSISGNSWTSLAPTPGAINNGGALTYPGSGDYIYALAGNSTTAFYRYSISGNSWTSMTGTPGAVNYGGALASAGGYIYAFAGNSLTAFYRYSISGNSWTSLAATPGAVYYGGALVYPGTGDFIYSLQGGYSSIMYRYSISGNSWAKMSIAPGGFSYGGSLAYAGTGNYIFATAGGNTTAFYQYSFGEWVDTTGAVSVQCFDCHNSHGSTAGDATHPTTSYPAGSGTVTGGLLKDTMAGKGGYSVNYRPASGGQSANKDAYNPGAGLCFDCHMNASGGTTYPWGYNSTFSAAQAVMGYWDTPYFAPGTFGSQARYPYKSGTGNQGGHFGASATMLTTPTGTINGLCTPCHDPHGVSPTLGANQQYGLPLLKGTWMTSPYKEDVAPASNGQESVSQANSGDVYHIDQNTFSTDVMASVTGITEPDSKFAGLCLTCHPKTSLTALPPATNASLTWKSKDRIHRAVAGWGYPSNTKHSYSCSKCHTPHNSRLQRLMVTNCWNAPHKGRVVNNASPVISGTGWEYCRGGSCYQVYSGSGSGARPGSGSGGGSGNWGSGSWSRTVTCHESDSADETWNSRTQW